MLSSRTRVVIGGASALAVSVLMALPAAAATHGSGIKSFRAGHVILDVRLPNNVTRAEALANATAASSTFTQFRSTVTVGAKSYSSVMAGENPAVKQTNPVSTIKTELIPVIMKFSNGDTWAPTKIDSCDSGASALSRVQKSPIFNSKSYTWGGTSVGTGQVTDVFQRAEFWKYAQPTGINPGYAVNLSVTTLSPITINVPNADAAVAGSTCGSGLLGAANINWLDPYLQKTVIPSLASKGVNAGTLPIFLVHNFVEYIGTTANCCVLGYHNAHSEASGIQTYGLSMYDNSRAFAGSHDISALSHEVGEWMDDPYTNNPTPSWGHIGQVSGCQTNLEVGDPLSGTTFGDALNGFTYHPQELAFFSWFYHQSPSLGVNGWYSDQGKFKTFAGPCP